MIKNNKAKIKILFQMITLIFKFSYIDFIKQIFLSTIIAILPYLSIILTQALLNAIQIKKSIGFITHILCVYLILKVFSLVINNYNNYLNKKYSESVIYNLNVLYLDKCKNLKYEDFENDKVYDMLLRANQQISTAPVTLLTNILNLISNIIGLMASAIILISWHWWAIFGFAILPVLSYKYFLIINRNEYEVYYKRTPLERLSWYYSQLLIKDYFIKEIKTMNISDYIQKKFNKIKKDIYVENIRLNKKRTLFNLIYQFLNLIFSSFVIIISVLEVISNKILIGNFMTYINTMSKVENTIAVITSSYYSLYTNTLYFSHLTDFLEYADKRIDSFKDKKRQCINEINKVEICNLSFKYPNTKNYAIKNLNFKIEKGDILALVGENGSGKSTLLKILTGLYDNYEGDIYINEINLRDIDKNSLVSNLSIIFQDYNCYEFDVKQNIGLGCVEEIENIKKIKYAAHITGADEFIEKFPNKYNQQLGNWFPNGVQISGGQWQKIAISRALMKTCSIYILDEPTSSLDPTSEYKFLKKFINSVHQSISIFATHRFVNAMIATKIIVLKNGNIIEIGTHDELIKKNGEYNRLFNLQMQGGIKK